MGKKSGTSSIRVWGFGHPLSASIFRSTIRRTSGQRGPGARGFEEYVALYGGLMGYNLEYITGWWLGHPIFPFALLCAVGSWYLALLCKSVHKSSGDDYCGRQLP